MHILEFFFYIYAAYKEIFRMLIAILKNLRPLVNVFSDLYFRTVYYIFNCIYFFVTKQSVKRPEDHLLLLSATKAAKLIHDGEVYSFFLLISVYRRTF